MPQMPSLSLNPQRVFSTDASSFAVCPWARLTDFWGCQFLSRDFKWGFKSNFTNPLGDGLAQLISLPAGSWSPTACV